MALQQTLKIQFEETEYNKISTYMTRDKIAEKIGVNYKVENIENGEYSYVVEAGSKANLKKVLGRDFSHYKLDIRFEKNGVVVLVETKQDFKNSDMLQLKEYVDEERALHPENKIIAILASINNDRLCVWKQYVDDEHLLQEESALDTMDHYCNLFESKLQNDRETVLRNTFALNTTLHKLDIDEKLRSQFVGTTLLYIKDILKQRDSKIIDEKLVDEIKNGLEFQTADGIRASIGATLEKLLGDSDNKAKKIELLRKNVLEDQKVRRLTKANWIALISRIILDIYRYIDADSSEGQDILNMFFIAFNKYTGKADKNQAFTPDHITEFMCRVTNVDHTKVVLDATCGSGSFLVQAMVKELADCKRGHTEAEAAVLMDKVTREHIYGIEVEEKAFGLATTNMLIHSDGNSNVICQDMFECADFIKQADPDIILMNPPYNAKPKGIPETYKKTWSLSQKNGKEDPTKGFVFLQFISDTIQELNKEKIARGESPKFVKMAILLPVSAAIGSGKFLTNIKSRLLENNRLDAVFTLPDEIFYPGASVNACCMVFTLGMQHKNSDGTTNETFFGYFKEDGFKKKKNLGRIELFNENGISTWKKIEEIWLSLYRNKKIVDGLSSASIVTGEDEWLCEAYMKTDYAQLSNIQFEQSILDYVSFLIRNRVAGWENYIDFLKAPSVVDGKLKVRNPLDTSKWKEVKLSKLFDVSLSKGDLKADDAIEGYIPLVSSGESNNGIVKYIDAEGDGVAKMFNPNTITLDMFCHAFYQPSKYYAVSHGRVNILTPKDKETLNEYVALFLTTLINFEVYRFSYGRAVYSSVAKDLTIKIPMSGKKPDWQFMENYIKSLPYSKNI